MFGLSVLDHMTGETHPLELPRDNSIFDFGGPLAGELSQVCDQIVSKNLELQEADDTPPANTLALLCHELELSHAHEVEKAMNPPDDGADERNAVLNSVFNQLQLKGGAE